MVCIFHKFISRLYHSMNFMQGVTNRGRSKMKCVNNVQKSFAVRSVAVGHADVRVGEIILLCTVRSYKIEKLISINCWLKWHVASDGGL